MLPLCCMVTKWALLLYSLAYKHTIELHLTMGGLAHAGTHHKALILSHFHLCVCTFLAMYKVKQISDLPCWGWSRTGELQGNRGEGLALSSFLLVPKP